VLLLLFYLQDGYMVSSGDPTRVYLDSAVRHVMLRQGVLGIKVRALLGLAAIMVLSLVFGLGEKGCNQLAITGLDFKHAGLHAGQLELHASCM
jgi:hypothetical protein